MIRRKQMHVPMFRLWTYPRVYTVLLPKWETETRFPSFPSKQWRNTVTFPESLLSCLQMFVIAFFVPKQYWFWTPSISPTFFRDCESRVQRVASVQRADSCYTCFSRATEQPSPLQSSAMNSYIPTYGQKLSAPPSQQLAAPCRQLWLRERQRTSPPPAASFCLPPDYWCRCIRPRNLCSSLLPKTWAPSGQSHRHPSVPDDFRGFLAASLSCDFSVFAAAAFSLDAVAGATVLLVRARPSSS